MKKLSLLVLVIVTVASCTPSTKIEKSWMEPGSSVTADPQNKTLIIAMVKDETSRRVIEDELVKRLKSPSVSSYTVLNSETLKAGTDEALNQVITKEKF